MSPALKPAAAAPAPPADELTDDLKWDFLRDLVEEELAKLQPSSSPAPKTKQAVMSHEAFSGASTAYSSPAGRPVETYRHCSPHVSPLGGPAEYQHAPVPRISASPAMKAAQRTPKMSPLVAPRQPVVVPRLLEVGKVQHAPTLPRQTVEHRPSRFSVCAEDYAAELAQPFVNAEPAYYSETGVWSVSC